MQLFSRHYIILYAGACQMTNRLSLLINSQICICGGNAAFSFFPCLCGGKTPCKRKTAYSAVFQGHWGEYPRSITTDCRLWRIKGGRYGAAVKENSRSKRLFSVCSARVGSAVRKSVIFERTAFPSKIVSTFSTRF